MTYTLDQLEAFVSSAHYDSATAGLIARGVSTLKVADGELISPGVRRIRGNLCNVHGRYGPCDRALSGKKPKKGRKPAAPKKTDAQRATERTAKRDQNASDVAKQIQDSDTGLSPSGSRALLVFAQGTQPDAAAGAGLTQMGLAEQASDGSYRMTPTGRAVVSAMRAGDYQRAVDAISRGSDASSARQGRATERTARQTVAQAKRTAAAAERSQRRAEREAAQRAKKPAKAASGGSKKPEKPAAKRPARQQRRGTASGATSSSSSGAKPEKPVAPKPAKAPAKQIAPALQTAADQLSQGATISDADTQALIRNGLARLNKEGALILTAAGMRATQKAYTMVDIYDGETWITTKAQTAEDRAMFAKMGGGGSGGGGGSSGGGSKLWPKGPSGKRTPQAAAAQSGGGGDKGDSKADSAARDQAQALVTKRDETQRKMRMNTDPSQTQTLFDRWRELDDAVQDKRRAGHISEADSKPLRDNSSTARIPVPKVRNNNADKRRSALHLDAQKHRALAATYPKGSAGRAAAEARLRDIGEKLNKIDDETIKPAKGKDYTSFTIFKDANGQPRWVAQSSTAFQDRDKEIVSTKALADDCIYADQHDAYGPLRWWHTPGLDLGDCDFNAMHGRVLIESGTFRSPAIAQKVALAANGLEISLGFIHLPNEPDADGVFHHIRRFERSLVPRGKASNRFTAFRVKETRMFDPTKVAALKQLGFSDDDITSLQSQAAATEKAATDQGVAFKADEPRTPGLHQGNYSGEFADGKPAPPEEITIGGVVYAVKAFPPKKADDEPVVEAVIETDAMDEMPMEEEPADDPSVLTLSAGDLAAISEAIQSAVATIMGGLDLEKKVASHVQGLLAPMQQAQTTKDAEAAQTKEQLTTLAAQVADLTGSAPAAAYRPSAASDNVLTDARLLAAIKADNDNDPWADIKKGLGLAQPQ